MDRKQQVHEPAGAHMPHVREERGKMQHLRAIDGAGAERTGSTPGRWGGGWLETKPRDD
jgi:hypothetical protein